MDKGLDSNMADVNELSQNGVSTQPKKLIKPVTEEQWFDLFSSLNTTLNKLSEDVSDLKGFKGKLSSFTPEWKTETDSHLDAVYDNFSQQDFRIKLLTNVVIRQEEKIKALESKLESSRSKDSNLISFSTALMKF